MCVVILYVCVVPYINVHIRTVHVCDYILYVRALNKNVHVHTYVLYMCMYMCVLYMNLKMCLCMCMHVQCMYAHVSTYSRCSSDSLL